MSVVPIDDLHCAGLGGTTWGVRITLSEECGCSRGADWATPACFTFADFPVSPLLHRRYEADR